MRMLEEFKEFAIKGNVVDMAVGVIIGSAFGKIVSSFVGDIIMPPIGVLISGVNFSDLAITLKQATITSPAVMLNYGRFIQTVIDFIIIAFSIFLMVKILNRVKRKKAEEIKTPAAPEPSKEEILLAEIRDILKGKTV